MLVSTPVSIGELLDKITILEIKLAHITDTSKRANIAYEFRVLTDVRDRSLAVTEEVASLTDELKRINETLWQIEDDIRDCERCKAFGTVFINLARSVYLNNDRRAALKRTLNVITGSDLIEEKSYQEYG